MFDSIFLPNPSFKSTFAQNKSCRSSLPLQILFLLNFKFLYQSLSFGWSNTSKNQSKFIEFTVFPLYSPLCSPTPIPATVYAGELLHASIISAIVALRAPPLSSRVHRKLLLPSFPSFHPLPRARVYFFFSCISCMAYFPRVAADTEVAYELVAEPIQEPPAGEQ